MTHETRFAREIVRNVLDVLADAASPHAARYAFAGSFRRGSPTCGDADLLVVPDDATAVREAVRGIASRVLYDGNAMLYVLMGEVPAQVFLARPDEWGSSLQYTTGSKDHNVVVRAWAKRRGLTANQHGVFRRSGKARGLKVPGSSETEAGFYRALGLRWPRPEVRARIDGGVPGIFPLTRKPSGYGQAQGDGRDREDVAPSGASQPADRLTTIYGTAAR